MRFVAIVLITACVSLSCADAAMWVALRQWAEDRRSANHLHESLQGGAWGQVRRCVSGVLNTLEDADADLPILNCAKAEYGKLQ